MSFAPDITGGRDVSLEFSVARCFTYPQFIAVNADLIDEELREGLTDAEAAARIGDRCGVLNLGETLRGADRSNDYAVLQLARPVPHPVSDPSQAAGAGLVFVPPVPVVDTPPEPGTVFSGMAVGYGQGSLGQAGGVRRYKRIEERMATTTVEGNTVAVGDSGGPLLLETASGFEVLGVATTEGVWAVLGQEATRSWIASRVDANGDGRVDTFCAQPDRGANPNADAANDGDGDGYLDAADTCPTTYNPCQVLTDVDDDGATDDCDACPADPSVDEPTGPLVPDGDMDGIADVCDCNPTEFDDPADDADRDFIRQRCDNCPARANPFQENQDGDNRGDVCDGCPLTAGDDTSDRDGDARPNLCDNCPNMPNPLQENCNLDAEEAAGLYDPPAGIYGAGDACDVTPCAETQLSASTREVREGGLLFRETSLDSISVDARSEDPQDARTGFRFCRCSGAVGDDPTTRRECRLGQADGTGECELADTDNYDIVGREPRTWRFMQVEYGDVVVVRSEALRQEVALDYASFDGDFVEDVGARWDQATDRERWTVTFPTDPPAQELPGVLWTHTPGPLDLGVFFPEGTRDLSSHYWSGMVPEPVRARAPFECYSYVGPAIVSSAACAVCSGLNTSWIGFGGSLAYPSCTLPDLFEPPVLIGPDLTLPAELAFASDPAEAFLGVDGSWVPAAEPIGWLPDVGFRYAALSADASFVERAFFDSADGLLRIDPCPDFRLSGGGIVIQATEIELCLPRPVLPVLARNAQMMETTAPATAVLSARREALWVVGGEDGLIRIELRSGVREELGTRLDLLFGRVLAATYAPVEDALYVLDEIVVPAARRPVAGARHRARLIRVAPDGTGAVVVARFARSAASKAFGLATDPAGHLWIASSGTTASRHAVARLDTQSQPPVALGFRTAPGLLATPIIRANAAGLSIMVRTPAGDVPVEHRVTELLPAGRAALSNLF